MVKAEMELKLNLEGLFKNEQEVTDMVRQRKICYDSEPYNIYRKGQLIQIGFQLNLYATFSQDIKDATPDSTEYGKVESDVMKLAEALSSACNPLHMCESTTIEPSTITYSHDRKMRPDVTVHMPIFDQKNFGHPVDDNIKNTLNASVKLLESVGVQKTSWKD